MPVCLNPKSVSPSDDITPYAVPPPCFTQAEVQYHPFFRSLFFGLKRASPVLLFAMSLTTNRPNIAAIEAIFITKVYVPTVHPNPPGMAVEVAIGSR